MTSSPSESTQPSTRAAEPEALHEAGGSAHEPTAEPQAAIGAAMAALDRLDTLPAGEHAEAFDRVHTALADALSAIDGV